MDIKWIFEPGNPGIPVSSKTIVCAIPQSAMHIVTTLRKFARISFLDDSFKPK